MKWAVRIPAVALISIAFALLLSQIPYFQASQHSAVFRQKKEINLSENNIVDVMQQIPIYLRVHKVEVSPTMLSVDLLLSDRTAEQPYVFHDLYEMPRFLFQQTENMAHIFIRVLESGSNKNENPSLLVAVGARREQFTGDKPGAAKMTSASMEQYVRSHYRLIETSRWNDLLPR